MKVGQLTEIRVAASASASQAFGLISLGFADGCAVAARQKTAKKRSCDRLHAPGMRALVVGGRSRLANPAFFSVSTNVLRGSLLECFSVVKPA